MAPRYKVTLTEEERDGLETITRHGKTTAPKFIHAREGGQSKIRDSLTPAEPREWGQSKIRDRSENPTACGCMYFQIQPARARVGAPEGERAPRERRCRAHRVFRRKPFRSHCRADRRVGRLSRRSRPPPETALRA